MKHITYLLLAALACTTAGARPVIYSTYEKVKQANVVLLGTITNVDASVAIDVNRLEVYKGQFTERTLRLPFRDEYRETVESAGVMVSPGQTVLLFLRRTMDDSYVLVGGGQGAISVDGPHGEGEKESVKQLIVVESAKTETVRADTLSAMLKGSVIQKRAALDALLKSDLSPSNPMLNATLISLLDERDFTLRRDAVLALGRLGVQQALPELNRKLKDEQPAVRSAAAAALRDVSKPKPRKP